MPMNGKLQQPVEALLGLDVDMAAPGDVGERAGGEPQPPVGGRLAGEQAVGPARERGARTPAPGRRAMPTICAPSTSGSR